MLLFCVPPETILWKCSEPELDSDSDNYMYLAFLCVIVSQGGVSDQREETEDNSTHQPVWLQRKHLYSKLFKEPTTNAT